MKNRFAQVQFIALIVAPSLLSVGCSSAQTKVPASKDGLVAAQQDVASFKTTLKNKSSEELMNSFIADGPKKYGGYEYYYNYMANAALREELKSRGPTAAAALRAHLADPTRIWEAVNGPGETIGMICKDLLDTMAGGETIDRSKW